MRACQDQLRVSMDANVKPGRAALQARLLALCLCSALSAHVRLTIIQLSEVASCRALGRQVRIITRCMRQSAQNHLCDHMEPWRMMLHSDAEQVHLYEVTFRNASLL